MLHKNKFPKISKSVMEYTSSEDRAYSHICRDPATEFVQFVQTRLSHFYFSVRHLTKSQTVIKLSPRA
jgi:hypothetical protein